jgi:cell wall assembly regulator SMI1
MPKIVSPSMPVLVDHLERWLAENRPVYHSGLRPGASEKRLMALERDLGRNLPAGLRALYRWHDGQSPDCPLALQHDWTFMPLDDVCVARAALAQLADEGEFPESNWWSSSWVPFLDNGRGDHLCVDLDGTFDGPQGQVVHFHHDHESRDAEFPGLESWLAAFMESLDAGLWAEQGSAFEPLDEKEVRVIQHRVAYGYPRTNVAGGRKLTVFGW